MNNEKEVRTFENKDDFLSWMLVDNQDKINLIESIQTILSMDVDDNITVADIVLKNYEVELLPDGKILYTIG